MEILAKLSALGLSEEDFARPGNESEMMKKIHNGLDAYFKANTAHWPYDKVPEFTVKDYITGRLWVNAILFTIRDWNHEIDQNWPIAKSLDARSYHMVIDDRDFEPDSRLRDEQYLNIAHHPTQWGIFQIDVKEEST